MKECFECKSKKDLQEHHVVPRLRGGTMTVTLCYSCHKRAHGRDSKGLNHAKLTKEGLAKCDKPLGSNNPKVIAGITNQTKVSCEMLFPALRAAYEAGARSNQQVVEFLNHNEITTPRAGAIWTRQSVARYVRLYKAQTKN